MAVKRFLTREVKQDGKGLYVHHGSYRLRPLKQKSRFEVGGLVSMLELYHHEDCLEMAVFKDIEKYELWRTK